MKVVKEPLRDAGTVNFSRGNFFLKTCVRKEVNNEITYMSSCLSGLFGALTRSQGNQKSSP